MKICCPDVPQEQHSPPQSIFNESRPDHQWRVPWPISVVGAATTMIFVTSLCLPWQNTSFVATKGCLPRQKLCCDMHTFVTIKDLSWQTHVCRYKSKLVATNTTYFSQQNFRHDKNTFVVATSMLLSRQICFWRGSSLPWQGCCRLCRGEVLFFAMVRFFSSLPWRDSFLPWWGSFLPWWGCPLLCRGNILLFSAVARFSFFSFSFLSWWDPSLPWRGISLP